MNENYDKYRPLLEVKKTILVVGEVNTGEDKPKIFPQEIMLLEDAPRKYTKQVHFRLNMAHLQPEDIAAVAEIVGRHPGKCPLFLCFQPPPGGFVLLDTSDRFNVAPSLNLQQEVEARFGENTYYAKVDTSLPEKVQRRWGKKSENNGDE
jgi:hypothetical protein